MHIFSRMQTRTKAFLELFTPTLNKIAVSIRHVPSTPAVLHAGLDNHLRGMQTDEAIKQKKVEPFQKSNTNIKVQSQVMTMNTLTNMLYMLP